MPTGVYKRKPLSTEHKLKISKSMKGKQNTLGIEPWNKGRTGVYTEETLQKMRTRQAYRGSQHPSWSEKPTYSGIHQWITRTLGKPMVCENCGFKEGNSRDYHWANLSGNYTRDISDWARLCIWCHFAIDNTVTKGWKTKKGIN